MPDKRQLLTIVVPLFNEEAGLSLLWAALAEMAAGLDLDVEFMFVDDGSADGTVTGVEALAAKDGRVRLIGLSRNFGKEAAVTAGLQHAKGDAVVIIDADLQHPVSLIPEFVRRWRAGAEVVVGVRLANHGTSRLRQAADNAFYSLLNAVSDTPITPNATDFRLLDRVVVDEFNRFTERQRLTRALIDWLGFRREYVNFEAPPRTTGASSFGPLKLMRLALNSFVAHSLFPLRFAGYLGAVITLFSGALGLFIFVEKYLLHDPWSLNFSGPAILAVINMFLIGIVLSCLGLVALYVASIHGEVMNRPLYAVRTRRNLR
jgi:dolichol-phosphate mannosyltransferase